jgi:hypothetical protein
MPPRAEQWADRICVELGKSVESILEVGRLLIKAKSDLHHGEWLRLFDDGLLPFKRSWAEMFMAIAKNQLLNSHDRGNLPPAVGTLYQLTRADPTKLKNALKDGVITPDMPRKAVAALMPVKPEPRVSGDDERFDPHTAVVKLIHEVRTIVATWPDAVSLDPLILQLRREADRLEQSKERHVS